MSKRAFSIALLTAAMVFVLSTAVAIAGVQAGWWGFGTALRLLNVTAVIGVVLLLAGLAQLAFAGRGGRLPGSLALILLLVPLLIMLMNRVSRPPGPPINDITTAPEEPPAFDAVRAVRPPDSNPVEYGGTAVTERQRELYPDIRPIYTDLPLDNAFQRALSVAESMGWEIVSRDTGNGVIEAVDTTPFFRYKDDIVIRVRASDAGSRIDLRSLSRVGRSDLGKNAARIREFIDEFQ